MARMTDQEWVNEQLKKQFEPDHTALLVMGWTMFIAGFLIGHFIFK